MTLIRMTSVLCLTLVIAACGEEAGPGEPPPATPVATVALNVVSDTFLVRSPVLLAATLRDSAGDRLENRAISWSVSDPALATVSNLGEVHTLALGVVTITATVEGKAASAVITLVPRVTVSRRLPTTFAGDTTLLTAVLTDVNGDPVAGSVEAWTSSDEAIATVTPQGVVTGVAAGRTAIRATAFRGSDSVELVVLDPTPRANREITYLRPRLTPQQIYVQELVRVEVDGTNSILVSEPDQNVDAWEWSPSGDRIAVTYLPVDDGDHSGLYTMDPDGSGARELVPGPVSHARWSPDGQRLVFSRGTPALIHTLNADGTGLAPMPSLQPDQQGPEWSPDGRQIGFLRPGTLWLMGADGTNERQVDVPLGAGNLAWSPDGKLIAFNTTLDMGGSAIRLVNSDGTNPRVFTPPCSSPGECGEYLRPRWSPDGTRLAYMSLIYGVGMMMIHVANLDGSEVSSFEVGVQIQRPSVEWSPDGRRLVFTTRNPAGVASVAVTEMDGSGPVTVAEDGDVYSPSWRR